MSALSLLSLNQLHHLKENVEGQSTAELLLGFCLPDSKGREHPQPPRCHRGPVPEEVPPGVCSRGG